MRIQKIIFSCSEPPAYSSYWNMQSRLYREGLGIEPICLLFGKKANTDMTEDYGRVIEREILPDLPWVIQMTFSKFDFTRTEPDTTWMIGDIDLVPMCRRHFVDNIADVPDDRYLCLNHNGISYPRMGRANGFLDCGSERHGKDGGFVGCDLPAHYHVAKGALFERLYFGDKTLRQLLDYVVESGRFGMGSMAGWPKDPAPDKVYWWYWVAEENYTSYMLWNAIKAGQVNYQGFSYSNVDQRIGPWTGSDYAYDPAKATAGEYVDSHCCYVRPYAGQAEALERLLKLTGLLKAC